MNNELLHENGIKKWLDEKLPEYRMRPHTGKLWLDVFYLVILAALESSILGSVSGPYLGIDLMTPWLVLSVIQKKSGPATVIAIAAGLIQEAQSSVPSGTYLCIYWIVTNILLQVRSALSWRSATPWFVVFLFSCLFAIIFQLLVKIMVSGSLIFNPWEGFGLLVQLGVSVGFGLVLCRQWLAIDAEEPVPQ